MDLTSDMLIRGLTLASTIIENGEKLPSECLETAFILEFTDAETAKEFIGKDPTKIEDFVVRLVTRACKTYNLFDRVRAFDPLKLSEELAQDEADVNILGLGFVMLKSRTMKQIMDDRNDSEFGCSVGKYLGILEDLKFELVMELPIKDKDKFYVFYRPDGLLLRFDTYQGKSVNSATVYYNWKPNPGYWDQKLYCPTGSGGWEHPDDKKPEDLRIERRREELIRVGSFDAREGIRGTIQELEKHGRFLAKWIKHPSLWLCHYGDTEKKPHNYTYYDEVKETRKKMLPQRVQEMIGDD